MSYQLEALVTGEEAVDTARLAELMAEAREYAKAVSLEGGIKDLTLPEFIAIGLSFQRQLLVTWPEREIIDMAIRHQTEIILGAMVAKDQMGAVIDGESPGSNLVGGPLVTRACWLGVGDDWPDINGIYAGAQGAWTTGTPQDWIHAGTNLLGGTAGATIRVLENAVHVIFALGSEHPSPKIESVACFQDDKPRPVVTTFRQQRSVPGTLRVKELDRAYLLKKDTTFRTEVMISEAFGAESGLQTDYPYCYSISYIKEPQLRVHDPVNVPGVTNGIVIATA